MLKQLQEFASKSCLDFGQLKQTIQGNDMADQISADAGNHNESNKQKKDGRAEQVRLLIGELRSQLGELEQFAWVKF